MFPGESIRGKYKNKIDVLDESTWIHLIIPYEDLTKSQKDRIFCYHAATGGDMVFLSNGMVLCV